MKPDPFLELTSDELSDILTEEDIAEFCPV